jgi:hypothetical protein
LCERERERGRVIEVNVRKKTERGK